MSQPKLIGYFPKRVAKRPDYVRAANVDEICSVSEHISNGPKDWIDHWVHNEMWVFDSPEIAWGLVSETERHEFELFGYKLFPFIFVDGIQKPFEIPEVHPTSLPASFEQLGYDIVSRTCGSSLECSPLSCNDLAKDIPVNSYCLVDNAEAALRLAVEFKGDKCEPGPYHVIDVWREKRPA
jgi:hypothetical protein